MAGGPPRPRVRRRVKVSARSTPASRTGLDGHVNYTLVMRNERDDLVAIGPVSIEYQAVMIRDELEESAGWTTVGIARVLTEEQARTRRRVSLAARIPAVAARDWRTLAEQEGGTQMRTITSFLLPARTSCTRSFRHVQLSVPPRQAAV